MLVLEEEKEAILKAMGDKYDRVILFSTSEKAMPIEEIAKEYNIPVSTCYRRVHELTSKKLLRVEKTIITDGGKKFETYRSTVKDASVHFSPEQITVDITPRPCDPDEKLIAMWKSVRSEPYSPVG